VAALAATMLISSNMASAAPTPAPAVTGDARVDALLQRMTLAEKITMIEGSAEVASEDKQYQAGTIAGVPRLGIPSLKLTDGPPGVITKQDSTGMTSTMGVAATFSQTDAQANGRVIGRDAKALGQDVVLEPFVNMDRDTSGSRNFNTFGEDPLLTGQTGAAEIQGIQSQGTMAQVKHYIAYDGVGNGTNVKVGSQTLHEIYLQPFTDAVNAGMSSVMCSYNKVNDQQACANATTLTQILRNELGFKGFVTSDWGAAHNTTDINAGLDMEMPGSGGPGGTNIKSFFSQTALTAAVKSGSVQESRITEAAGRVLYQMDRFGLLTGKSKHSVTAEPTRADQSVVQRTAEDAATLLKNDSGTLPLTKTSLAHLALIGPGAGQTIATNSGGEAAGGLISEQTSPLQNITSLTKGTGANVQYAVGDDLTGSVVPASALSHDGKPGLVRSSNSAIDKTLNFTTAGNNALPAGTAETWTGTLTAPTAGSYWLNIQALGATAGLTVDGKLIDTVGAGFGSGPRYGIVHPTDGNAPTATTDGLANGRTLVTLTAGAHTLSVTTTPDVSKRPVQVRLDWVTTQQQQANHDAAVAAAKKATTAVVYAWNTSGGDLSTPLPDGQDQLIEDVAAVNPNTVVVLQSGQPIALPWLSKVKSVLEAWYGGDQAGVASARTLLGQVNPAGRLPFTWPASLDQELAHQAAHPERSSAGVDGVTTYSEGINIGYRYYDATGEAPLYPFGYGLSYTSFGYSNLQAATASDGGLNVSFVVRNTGKVSGDEVPQVYLGAPSSQPAGVQFAKKALVGYDRITLAPGQSTSVTIHVPVRQLQYWTDAAGWTTAASNRVVTVGGNEAAAALTRTVTIHSY
jgi:beta-glucosidase